MHIRKGETDQVPEDTPCLLIWEDFTCESTTNSKTDIRRLYGHLSGSKPPKLVFALWRGQWRTDAFLIDQAVFKQRLEKWAAQKGITL